MNRISFKRVWAILVRHLFSWKRDIDALAEAFWWPTFDTFLWGLVTVSLKNQGGSSFGLVNFFLGALVLWMFVYRSQQEMGFLFLREAWDRNLLNIFTTPISMSEFMIASLMLGMTKLIISAVWMGFLAFILFSFNIFSLGFWLIPFVINLLMIGWSAGFIINSLIITHGYRVQSFAWTLIIIIQPFSAVFYPVSAMPNWMQVISKVIPTSYIFEGMRKVFLGGYVDIKDLLLAFGLNVVYLILSIMFFSYSFRKAKESGMLLKFS